MSQSRVVEAKGSVFELATPWGGETADGTQTGTCFGYKACVSAQDVTRGSDRMWIHQVMFRVLPTRQQHGRALVAVVAARQYGVFFLKKTKQNKMHPTKQVHKKKPVSFKKIETLSHQSHSLVRWIWREDARGAKNPGDNGAGKAAQWAKCSPGSHEDPSSMPRIYIKIK